MNDFGVCLYSIFLGHGVLDFFILSKKTEYIFWYLGIIILYKLLLELCHKLFLITFIITSGFHFGLDFKFITYDRTNLSIFMGWFFIASTLNCKNYQGLEIWAQFLKEFNFTEIDSNNTINFIKNLSRLSFFSIICGYNQISSYLILLSFFMIFCVSKIELWVYFLIFVDCFHVPITLLRFYNSYGKISILVLTVGIIITYNVLESITVEEDQLELAISISMAHMIFMTLWEYNII